MQLRKAVLLLGSLSLTLVPVRSAAQIAVVSPGVEERQAHSGESYTGTIRVRNLTAEPQEVKLYLTDYQFHADGRTVYGLAGSTPRSSAEWTTVNPSYVVLAPGAETPISYTVAVPRDANPLAGTYWTMVMVEPVAAGSAESTRSGRPRLGVDAVVRHGIQLVTHIGATGRNDARIEQLRVTPRAEGGRGLEFEVRNVGERAWRVDLVVELYDAAGTLVERLTSSRGLLYAGSSIRQQFVITGLPGGAYQALVLADTGADEIFGAQFRVAL